MALTDIRYIAFDGEEVYRPPGFAPKIEDLYAGEYKTCTGKIVGDRIGWKYADMTLSWDGLPQSMVDILIGLSGQVTFEFEAPDGTIVSEPIIRSSVVQLRNRNTIRGEVFWKDVSMDIRFIGAHNE